MGELFYRVLSVSLTTSLVLLPLLLAAGRLGKRYAAGTLSAVWLVLAIRLLVPASPALPQAAVMLEAPAETVILTPPSGTVHDAPEQSGMPEQELRPMSLADAAAVVAPWIWLLGCGVVLAWHGVSYAAARRDLLRRTRPLPLEVQAQAARVAALVGCRCPKLAQVEGLPTPMLLGVFRPVLLLPGFPAEGDDLELVLRHEIIHLRRRDGLRKLLILLAAALHWFNPLVWWLAREGGRSLELCCDSEVIKGRDAGFRRRYGALLIQTAAGGPSPVYAIRLSGGKDQLKRRLENLFAKKKNSAAGVCVVLAVTVLAGTLVSCGSQTVESQGAQQTAEVVALKAQTPLTASEALDALEKSVTVVEDTLAFTIPKGYEGEDSWNISIAGRAEFPDFGGMSLHYLDGTAWTAGETYTVELAEVAGFLTDLTLSASLGEETREVDLMPWFRETVESEEETPGQTADSWIWPLPGYEEISNGFGKRVHPITGAETEHDGLDISAPEGTQVLAAAAGTVTACGYDAEDGNYVELDHGDGISTRYTCLAERWVEEGDTVTGGTAVGTVGATGAATGPHLHLELCLDGEPVDPQASFLGTEAQNG
jgi:murein DD-endopeptidase MepM/ murein hydrolase activator NlpD